MNEYFLECGLVNYVVMSPASGMVLAMCNCFNSILTIVGIPQNEHTIEANGGEESQVFYRLPET